MNDSRNAVDDDDKSGVSRRQREGAMERYEVARGVVGGRHCGDLQSVDTTLRSGRS